MVVIPAVEPEIKTVKLPDLNPLFPRTDRIFSVISMMMKIMTSFVVQARYQGRPDYIFSSIKGPLKNRTSV